MVGSWDFNNWFSWFIFSPKKKEKGMRLRVDRTTSAKDHTNGRLYIDDVFECYTLEDEKRDEKIKGETRIPEGIYEVFFRKVGGFHQKTEKYYGSTWHIGMLEVQNVPNFKYILIHCGNTDEDTAGCLLVGAVSCEPDNYIGQSRKAYKKLYPKVRNALL